VTAERAKTAGLLAVGLLALSQVAAVCGTQVSLGCERDGDCQNFQYCEVGTGFCLCSDNNACDANEFCNETGRCQPRLGCISNKDCATDDGARRICDTKNDECVELDGVNLSCTLDSHCPFGSVCEGSQCAPGCRENGDCPAGQPCIERQCNATPGACNENHYCDYGQSCDLANNSCITHPDASTLCQTCTPDALTGVAPECGAGDPCLIDTSLPPQSCSNDAQCSQWPGAACSQSPCYENTDCANGATCEGAFGFIPGQCSTGLCRRHFCGSSDCDAASPCPKGYGCNTLITVPANSGCTNSSQCAAGAECIIGGENENQGFCECLSDTECGQFECGDLGGIGVCITGTTCGPQAGLLCEDLR
jgi:hypothetical protein